MSSTDPPSLDAATGTGIRFGRGAATGSWEVVLELAEGLRPAVLPVALVTSVFLELLLAGGDRREVALAFAALQSLIACAVVLPIAFARKPWRAPAGSQLLIGLLAGLILTIVFQFLPFPHGFSEVAWQTIGAHGSITIDRFATAVELAKLAGLAALFISAVAISGRASGARIAMSAILVLGSAYAIWALFGYYTRILGVVVTDDHRLCASMPTPNVCAGFMGALAVLAWTQCLSPPRAEQRHERPDWRAVLASFLKLRSLALLVLMGAALWDLALTASRGAALATVLSLGLATGLYYLTIANRRSKLERFRKSAGALILIGVLAIVGAGPLLSRLDPKTMGETDRLRYFQLYFTHLADAPLAGYGLGTFKRFNAYLIAPEPGIYSWELGAMHNVYLQWLYEAGPVGAVLMVATVTTVVVHIAKRLTSRQQGRAIFIAAIAITALFAIHDAVDIDLQFAGLAAFWTLILGMGFGLTKRRGARARYALAN